MFAKSEPSLRAAAAFLASEVTTNQRHLQIEPQRTSALWWLQYLLDRLWRRSRSNPGLRLGHGRATAFSRLGDAFVQQDHERIGLLDNRQGGEQAERTEREVLRRLIAIAESLPYATRVTFSELPFPIEHDDEAEKKRCTYTTSLGTLVEQTRREQAEEDFQNVNKAYDLDALENLLDTDPEVAQILEPVIRRMPLPRMSDEKRVSERIITVLGSPSRLYYLALFFMGLLLCLFYVLLRTLLNVV